MKNPAVTADVICEKDGKILLIRRAAESSAFANKLAFPGGFIDTDKESIEKTAVREAKEETNVDVQVKEILGVYSDPKRDPRGHTVTTAFIVEWKKGEPKAADDAKEAKWVSIEDVKPEELAFDHAKIFSDYLKWRKEKGTYWSGKNAEK